MPSLSLKRESLRTSLMLHHFLIEGPEFCIINPDDFSLKKFHAENINQPSNFEKNFQVIPVEYFILIRST